MDYHAWIFRAFIIIRILDCCYHHHQHQHVVHHHNERQQRSILFVFGSTYNLTISMVLMRYVV
jgi:hypothetical protein